MTKGQGFVFEDGGDMKAHEFFLYSLVRGVRPECILEIGVRSGVSTFAMTQALVDGKINYREYIACDIDPACKELQLPVPVKFEIMPSDELASIWYHKYNDISILLIDGLHEISQVRRDFYHFYPFVKRNGYILFHDTYPPTEDDKNPGACWDAYKIISDLNNYVMLHEIEYVTLAYSYGLTVCRKL